MRRFLLRGGKAVISWLNEFLGLNFAFMQRAYIAILLLTPLLALLGTMAVNKRMAFFSDALGHSALTGLGLGLALGISNVTISLVMFGVIFALLINGINRLGGADSDTNISAFSSMGIALGLFLLSKNGNFSRYSSLLTGDILAVEWGDIYALIAAFIIGLVFWLVFFNRLLITAVNPSLAKSKGIRSDSMERLFVCLVAVFVMLAIRWVGVLLINALLILPAAAARNLTKSMRSFTLLSVAFAVFSGLVGMVFSFHSEGASVGASVVIVAGLIYALSLVIRRSFSKFYS